MKEMWVPEETPDPESESNIGKSEKGEGENVVRNVDVEDESGEA